MAFLFAKSFPFCVAESNEQTGDGTEYPFEMTLEDAMALYWKFLSVKVTDSISYSFIHQPGFFESNCDVTHSFSQELETTSYWPNKMSQMICPPSPYFYGFFFGENGSMTSTRGGGNVFTTSGSYELIYGTDVITKKINNEYKFYPRFLFSLAAVNEYGSGYSTKDNGGIQAKIVTLKLNGKDYKTNLYANGGLHVNNSLSGAVVIEKTSDRTAE